MATKNLTDLEKRLQKLQGKDNTTAEPKFTLPENVEVPQNIGTADLYNESAIDASQLSSDELKQIHLEHYKPYSDPIQSVARDNYEQGEKDEGKEGSFFDRLLGYSSTAPSVSGISPAAGEIISEAAQEKKEKIVSNIEGSKELRKKPIVEQFKEVGFDIPADKIKSYTKEGIPIGESGKQLVYYPSAKGGVLESLFGEYGQTIPQPGDPEYETYTDSRQYYTGNIKPFMGGLLSTGWTGELKPEQSLGAGISPKLTSAFTEELERQYGEEYLYPEGRASTATEYPELYGAGRLAGEIGKTAISYATFGPLVQKVALKVPQLAGIVTSVDKTKRFAGQFIIEMAKDLTIGAPLSVSEGLEAGLEKEDFWKYVATQLGVDALANIGMLAITKPYKNIPILDDLSGGGAKAGVTPTELQEGINKALQDPALVKQVNEILDNVFPTKNGLPHPQRIEVAKINQSIAESINQIRTKSVLANTLEIRIAELQETMEPFSFKADVQKSDALEDLLLPQKTTYSPEVTSKYKIGPEEKIATTESKKLPIKDRIKKAARTFHASLDPELPVKEINIPSYHSATNALNSPQQIKRFVSEEAFTPLHGKVQLQSAGKSLTDIMAMIPQGKNMYRGLEMDNYDIARMYIYHKHNVATAKVGKGTMKNFTSEQSDATTKRLEDELPWLKEMETERIKYTHTLLEWGIDGGKISQKSAEALMEKYPHYNPAYRNIEQWIDPNTKARVDIDPIKKIQGSALELRDPFQNLAKLTNDMILSSNENHWKIQLYESIKANPAKFADKIKIEKITTKKGKDIPLEPEMYVDTFKTPDYVKTKGNLVELTMGDKIVTLRIYDHLLFDRWFGGEKYVPKGLSAIVAKASSQFKKFTTQQNPAFSAKNVFYDTPSAYVHSSIINPMTFLKNLGESINEMANNSPLYQMYLRTGVTGSTFSISKEGAKEINKIIASKNVPALKLINTLDETMSFYSQFSENINRFAEFRYIYKKTGDLSKATYEAADITVNFAKGEGWIKRLENLSPYSKAATLASEKTYRMWKEHPRTTALKGIVQTVPYIISFLAFMSNPYYREEIPDYDRFSNYIIPNPLGRKDEDGFEEEFIKAPFGRGTSQFMNIMAVYTMDRLFGEGEMQLDEAVIAAASSLGPNNPIFSNIFTPIIEAKMGKSLLGYDLEPTRMKGMTLKERYDDTTSELSKALRGPMSLIGFSPIVTDYLIDRYTGFYGDVVLGLTTQEQPVVQRLLSPFTIDTAFKSRSVRDFYDKYNELGEVYNTEKYRNLGSTEAWIAKEKYSIMTQANSDINDFYGILKYIKRDGLSEMEKQALAESIERMNTKLSNAAVDTQDPLYRGFEVYVEDMRAVVETAQKVLENPEMGFDERKDTEAILRRRIIQRAKEALEAASQIEDIEIEDIIQAIMFSEDVSYEQAEEQLEQILNAK